MLANRLDQLSPLGRREGQYCTVSKQSSLAAAAGTLSAVKCRVKVLLASDDVYSTGRYFALHGVRRFGRDEGDPLTSTP